MILKNHVVGLALCLTPAVAISAVSPAFGQAGVAPAGSAANKLLSGKLIYVAPMPNELDTWITQSLTAWQRYKVTANPEGVDLVVRAVIPDENTRLRLHRGLPQAAKASKAPPTPSIKVLDWVTGAILWQADIVDKSAKKDAPAPSPSEHVEIPARGLSVEQLGARIARAFREYVESLQK